MKQPQANRPYQYTIKRQVSQTLKIEQTEFLKLPFSTVWQIIAVARVFLAVESNFNFRN